MKSHSHNKTLDSIQECAEDEIVVPNPQEGTWQCVTSAGVLPTLSSVDFSDADLLALTACPVDGYTVCVDDGIDQSTTTVDPDFMPTANPLGQCRYV